MRVFFDIFISKGGVRLKDRIKQIRKEAGLTQVEFGEKLGVKGNTVTGYETGLRNPTDAVILSICREFSVNEDWLRTGNGEMYVPSKKDDLISSMLGDVIKADESDFKRRLISALSKLDDSGWDTLEKLIDSISEGKEK